MKNHLQDYKNTPSPSSVVGKWGSVCQLFPKKPEFRELLLGLPAVAKQIKEALIVSRTVVLLPFHHTNASTAWVLLGYLVCHVLFSSVTIKTAFQIIVLVKTNVSLLSKAPGHYSSSFSRYLVSSKWDVSNPNWYGALQLLSSRRGRWTVLHFTQLAI